MPTTQIKPAGTDELVVGEQRAFERQKAQLLRRYEGQFVALYRGRVVAHDPDDEALAARMFAKLGEVAFWIARVEKRPTAYDLPSPEIEH